MLIGIAKGDITCFVKNTGMLGYGMFLNKMKDIATPLYCRAFAFLDNNNSLCCIAICELAFITDSLKQGILKQCAAYGITDSNLMLLAQHTHSGPGGYSHYALYNFTTPGFVPFIYDSLCSKISDTIIRAVKQNKEAQLFIGKSTFAPDQEVAFNRSLAAYNSNKDIAALDHEQRHLAVDRQMTLLQIQSTDAKPLGSINWFGVHTTSISNDNHSIHSDNKGYAATYLEQEISHAYIAAFAQGACGDVSPKFIYNPKRKAQRGLWEGKFHSDIESAKYNGRLQFEKALEICTSNSLKPIKINHVESYIAYYNFAALDIDPQYTEGEEGCVTSPSCHGMAFLGGAIMDGPGAPAAVQQVGKRLSKSIRDKELKLQTLDSKELEAIQRKYKAQGVKDIIIESGMGRVLGTSDIKNSILPGVLDGGIRNMKKQHRAGALITQAWCPQILPLQWIQLGNVALAAFPFEITTVASYRLQQSLQALCSDMDIDEIILCPYANSYNGYITTYEEYQVQMYEAGHTVFGQWSLAALQTCFKQLIQGIKSKHIISETPFVFTEEELQKRSYTS